MDTKTSPRRTLALWGLLKHFATYIMVGLVALAVDVSVFAATRQASVDLWIANPLARFAGAITAYTLHHRLTFKQATHWTAWWSSAWRYVLLWTTATTLGTLGVQWLSGLGLPEIWAKIMVEGCLPFFNFLIARAWVFKKSQEPSA
jgi:putative flippase GtrA